MTRRAIPVLVVAALAGCAGRPAGPDPRKLPTPLEIARADPCEYTGTLHRESRGQLERMRTAERLSPEEWECLSAGLETADREFTAACRSSGAELARFEDAKRKHYEPCLGDGRGAALEQAMKIGGE